MWRRVFETKCTKSGNAHNGGNTVVIVYLRDKIKEQGSGSILKRRLRCLLDNIKNLETQELR